MKRSSHGVTCEASAPEAPVPRAVAEVQITRTIAKGGCTQLLAVPRVPTQNATDQAVRHHTQLCFPPALELSQFHLHPPPPPQKQSRCAFAYNVAGGCAHNALIYSPPPPPPPPGPSLLACSPVHIVREAVQYRQAHGRCSRDSDDPSSQIRRHLASHTAWPPCRGTSRLEPSAARGSLPQPPLPLSVQR